ncbi:TPA: LacI family transcriptional regulator [Candidatus Poribacteria bacterium]|nr:LacI family transcriptional regulator [Candidatus Poribacteria bacterium]
MVGGFDTLRTQPKDLNSPKSSEASQESGLSVDGLLILPIPNTDGEIEILKARGIPVVLINRYVERHAFDCVYSDNQFGGYELTKHPLDLGHKRIAYIDHCYTSSAARDRFSGFRKTMDEGRLFHESPDESGFPLRSNLRFVADYRSQCAKNLE